MTTKNGKRLAFAIYVNNVPAGLEADAIRDIVG
jgi:D-alanyl-D-alanine carboxypeptidase